MSVGSCAVGLKRLGYREISVAGIDHEIPCHTCRGVDEIVVTVCSHAKIRLFSLSALARKLLQRLT